jgi:hypothetical protein
VGLVGFIIKKVDTESTTHQEIFNDNFSTFPPRLILLKIITTQCHLITRTNASAILRTNVHCLEPTWDTWSDSQMVRYPHGQIPTWSDPHMVRYPHGQIPTWSDTHMVRFPQRSEGPATFRTQSCRFHEKTETQSNSTNKWTINFIQVWVYMHYKNEKVKLVIVTWMYRFEERTNCYSVANIQLTMQITLFTEIMMVTQLPSGRPNFYLYPTFVYCYIKAW